MSELGKANAALVVGDILINNLRKDYEQQVIDIDNLNADIVELKEDRKQLINMLESYIAKDVEEVALLKDRVGSLQKRVSATIELLIKLGNSEKMD